MLVMRNLTEAQKARRAENLRRWRATNRERYRQTTRAWEARDGNGERIRKWRREWLAKNRERVNALARARYAANPELGRLKLKQKRERMGTKYRQQIKRSRAKVRSTPEGRIYHRMGQSIRSALRGGKRRCNWERILGYSRHGLRQHLEAQFTAGMTWEKFLAGEIDIDHVRPRMTFPSHQWMTRNSKSAGCYQIFARCGLKKTGRAEQMLVGQAPAMLLVGGNRKSAGAADMTVARTGTAEETKRHYIAKMGEELGSLYYALWQEVVWLHVEWAEYVELYIYGTKPSRIALLNEAAPSFFRLVQDGLFETAVLKIARLTDPPKSVGKPNLTVQQLPRLSPVSNCVIK